MAKKKEKMSLEEMMERAIVKEEERPYEVPGNWVWTYFENVVINRDSERIPLSVSQRSKMEKVYDYYGASGIIDKVEKFIFDKKLMLIGEDGANLITRSKPIAFLAEGKYWVNNHAHVLDSNRCIILQYLCYYINSIDLGPYVTGSAQPKMTQQKMNAIRVPLPPYLEQQRIVDIIEQQFKKLDTAKVLVQNALDSFENRKAAILHKAFTGELTAKWREENGVSLDEWEEKDLGKLIKNGPQNGLYKSQTAYGEGYKIVRIDNFYEGVINPWNTLKRLSLDENEKKVYGLENNDILINRVNSIQYLGKSALVRNLDDICVFESNVMRISLIEDMIPEYIIKYLNCELGLKELRKNAKHAVNQASINQTDVKNAIVVVPPINEQKEIVRILDNLLDNEQKAKEICDVIEKIDLMKKAILSRAFRGELGTNNPEEESAVELLKEILGK